MNSSMAFIRLFLLPVILFISLFVGNAMAEENMKKAIFAGGCFWCMESEFDYVGGVISTISGYTGGNVENPEYGEVSSGNTGHYEALEVTYDPQKVSYEKLLEVFWSNIDPTDAGGQFADRGSQYRTAIFYGNEEEKKLAEESKERMAAKLGKDVATKILPASAFYPAEEYHQNYHQKNPERYKRYKYGSGRPDRLKELWGDK